MSKILQELETLKAEIKKRKAYLFYEVYCISLANSPELYSDIAKWWESNRGPFNDEDSEDILHVMAAHKALGIANKLKME